MTASLLERAQSLRRSGRVAEAAGLLQQTLAAQPDSADALVEWGNLLKSQGRYADALVPLNKAAQLAPGQAAAWLNLGVALLELSRIDEAIAAFERAVALEPRRPAALNILGHALLLRGEPARAGATLEAALRADPRHAAAWDNLGRVRKAQGRAAEAVEMHRRALAAGAGGATHSNLLYTLNLVAGLDPGEIFDAHRRWGAAQTAGSSARTEPAAPGGRRIRVGYVSPDFCRHAVAHFIAPALARHDRSRFEVFCYSDVRVPDSVTEELRGLAEHWRDTSRMDATALEGAIRSDGIDILVDLAGHTANHRLAVFARRAARVQATWLGYPNTTGLSTMDFRLTDAVADPPGQTERWHTEQLLRLPGPFCCYRPPADAPAVAPLPLLSGGGVTFGCLNQVAKINPPLVELWSRILVRLPSARLLLKTRGIDDETRGELLGRFAAQGVAAGRVEIISESLSVPRHLTLYHRIDVALDTHPYNGTTTTCEALWMGVPVITLAGRTHVSRTGASLLSHLGLKDWIAGGADEYVAAAIDRAGRTAELAELRGQLRKRMRASAVCDEPGFVRGLEAALESSLARLEVFAA